MLDPRIRRLKQRLLAADYEICLARARRFTEVYRASEGEDPALRSAWALRRTLAEQAIAIHADEWIVGTKTERYLATPLPVERGDFLRVLQLELDILHLKRQPFSISAQDRRIFVEEILPYWDGRTLRDRKAQQWRASGVLPRQQGWRGELRAGLDFLRFARALGADNLEKILGANLGPLFRRGRPQAGGEGPDEAHLGTIRRAVATRDARNVGSRRTMAGTERATCARSSSASSACVSRPERPGM